MKTAQRSVYIVEDLWQSAREVAWRQHLSTSSLISKLLKAEIQRVGAPTTQTAETPELTPPAPEVAPAAKKRVRPTVPVED